MILVVNLIFWILLEEINGELNSQNKAKPTQVLGDKSVSNASLEEPKSIKRATSFVENQKARLQLSWRNVSIIAPPKRKLWRKHDNDVKGFTILGNS